MDIEDVSFVDQISALVQEACVNAERASSRKGEIPDDHPVRQPDHPITSLIPAAYPPCTVSAADLKPIFISQMELETHHRGTRIVVRVRTQPIDAYAIRAIVEDDKGTVVMLQVYNQPEDETVPCWETLRQGCFYLLKEPFFNSTIDEGTYSIQVDHVSDIVSLSEDDELIPTKWRKPKTTIGTSQSIRMEGNEAVRERYWAEAERLYTTAIEVADTTEDERLAYLNRSLANLRLGRPAKALTDAIKSRSCHNGPSSEKALFREATALYQLAKFEECLEKLEVLTTAYPSSASGQEANAMVSRVKTRLHEQQTGEYNFDQMYRQAKATPPLIDCATYSAPVEVRESPGRGRGLFTTRKVAASELLLCEKAFGYSSVADDQKYVTGPTLLIDLDSKKALIGGQASLLRQLVQKLYHDPEAAQSFTKLHAGEYGPVTVTEVDGRQVVDTFHIGKIMTLNVFGAPRTSRAYSTAKSTSDENIENGSGHEHCGVWYIASHMNHSCLPNCMRSFIGDMQILRATRDLDEGTELLFWYRNPLPFQSYEEHQKRFETWGFECDCLMCLDRKTTSDASISKRKSLEEERDSLERLPYEVNIPKAVDILHQLEQTFSPAATKPGAVRLETVELYYAVGVTSLLLGNPLDAVEMTLRGFEALGYVITACPRRGTAAEQRRVFRVDRWGVVVDFAVQAFLHLTAAYSRIAPELATAVIAHAKMAYKMAVGEDETFFDEYPELSEVMALV
ncbi:SET domain-containing protein [Coniochaeta ligniaria NRRL 30616]|uniref:SET domain-containing protein n=1 Tax=Coniochaeta ligniaria NRRL 30616 TaxID=1408157 RepID=A0A1J7J1L3_9PEZI|nr:SET domain-containing protein [Coniochaeta ligniaria NRRL 30616]